MKNVALPEERDYVITHLGVPKAHRDAPHRPPSWSRLISRKGFRGRESRSHIGHPGNRKPARDTGSRRELTEGRGEAEGRAGLQEGGGLEGLVACVHPSGSSSSDRHLLNSAKHEARVLSPNGLRLSGLSGNKPRGLPPMGGGGWRPTSPGPVPGTSRGHLSRDTFQEPLKENLCQGSPDGGKDGTRARAAVWALGAPWL